MPLNIHAKGTGPGQARIDIDGVKIRGKELEILVQRASDDAYVGSNASWQIEPHWHRLQRLPGVKTASFLADQDIVDALAKVARADSFLAQVRWGRESGQGVLAIRGELVSTAAMIRPPPPLPPIDDEQESSDEQETEQRPVTNQERERPTEPRASSWLDRAPWRSVFAISALLAALLFGLLLGDWFGSAPAEPQPQETASEGVQEKDKVGAGEQDRPTEPKADIAGSDAETASEPDEGTDLALEPESELPTDLDSRLEEEETPNLELEPEADPGLALQEDPQLPPDPMTDASGIDYVNKLVAETQDPTVYMAQAERRAERGDCDAVRLLYKFAAEANPKIAGQVAQLYDPQGFEPSACISKPSLVNATEYYEHAAEGGVRDAQRRLGRILITDRVSGPDRQDGLRWLREAATAGDDEAQRIIEGLNYRSFENR